MNVCLKFTDEAQAKSVLFAEDGTPSYRNIDTIGQITKLTGELDDQGQPITQTLDGWHVNVFLLPDENGSVLEAYTVYPSTPFRVWA